MKKIETIHAENQDEKYSLALKLLLKSHWIPAQGILLQLKKHLHPESAGFQ
ncbi:hypothetical protein [Listeria goaensis]|uniref:hypothetical protein n=1 Tax=Listeria goaensis TaxID=1649188 RepID=UPI001F073427|nr:hypothetical protein [Listeria goaensis]